jgi:hypothetical protein
MKDEEGPAVQACMAAITGTGMDPLAPIGPQVQCRKWTQNDTSYFVLRTTGGMMKDRDT